MAVAEFTPTLAYSGYIEAYQSGLSWVYNVYSGGDGYVGQSLSGLPWKYYRAYQSYDTSSLPNNAVISQVRMEWKQYGLASNNGPSDWIHSFWLGTFIGTTLDSTDWSGGSKVHTLNWPGVPGGPSDGWMTFGTKAPQNVNLHGYTDLCVRDVSSEAWPWGDWGVSLYHSTHRSCHLEVTYTLDPGINPGVMNRSMTALYGKGLG